MTSLDLGELYPKQIEFCKDTHKYICYGGARGGGKSHISRIKMILLAINYPGIQILLLRRTLKELRENHSLQLQKMLKDVATYRESSKEFIFPNGSRIVLGYCDKETDVLQFQGQAYEVIVLEEATHFTEFQFQSLTESNRMSGNLKVPFTPRMYFTCNPGGVGHQWVKRLFIDRNYRGTENPDDYSFIPAVVYENKYLMEQDPSYVKSLENLPEDRKQAMLYGNWDIFDGQFFPEFRRDIHIKEPFEIPRNWNRYIAFDYGLDMFAVLFIAVDTRGKAVVYKEIYKDNLIVSEASQLLKSQMRKAEYRNIYAPPDLWGRNRDTGKSTFEIFRDNGIQLTKASNNRKDGWLAVKEWLRVKKSRNIQTGEQIEVADLTIFSCCTNLIRCLPQLQHDEKDPNDCATEPHEITHICDALRYFCISRVSPSKEETLEEKVFGLGYRKQEEYDNFDVGEEQVVV
jgi:phage terminase large subunit